MATKLAIICPCFNEEEVIENSAKTLFSVIDGLYAINNIVTLREKIYHFFDAI